jgi:hypothetical protein
MTDTLGWIIKAKRHHRTTASSAPWRDLKRDESA